MKAIEALDITPGQLELLRRLFQQHLPGIRVWAFGSRLNGRSVPASDLDLVAFTRRDDARRLNDLRDALDESDLPFRVDLHAWDELPESYQAEIERRHLELLRG